MFLKLVKFIFSIGLVFSTFQVSAKTLKQWKGEVFRKNSGGFYLQLVPNDSNWRDKPVRTVFVTVVNVDNQTTYQFVQESLSPRASRVPIIWEAPKGKYYLKKLVLRVSGDSKATRVWRTSKIGKMFKVSPLAISNLGALMFKINEDSNRVSLRRKPTKNRYKLKEAWGGESVTAVVDGFSGKVQRRFTSKEQLKYAGYGNNSKDSIAVVSNAQRDISMHWSVMFTKQNRYAEDVNILLRDHSQSLQQCFLNLLNRSRSSQGFLIVAFKVPEETGIFSNLKKVKFGGIKKNSHLGCVRNILSNMQLDVDRSLDGLVKFSFSG